MSRLLNLVKRAHRVVEHSQNENFDDTRQRAVQKRVAGRNIYATIHIEKREVLNILDLGTSYGERTLVNSRSGDEIKRVF